MGGKNKGKRRQGSPRKRGIVAERAKVFEQTARELGSESPHLGPKASDIESSEISDPSSDETDKTATERLKPRDPKGDTTQGLLAAKGGPLSSTELVNSDISNDAVETAQTNKNIRKKESHQDSLSNDLQSPKLAKDSVPETVVSQKYQETETPERLHEAHVFMTELPEPSVAAPEIPPQSIGRRLSVSDMIMMDATRQQLTKARPVMVTSANPVEKDMKKPTESDVKSFVDTETTESKPQTQKSDATGSVSSESHATHDSLIVGVCVVGFHHARGPEVEYWVGPEPDQRDVWPYLPFQSLPDGSHQFEENICYFTLLYDRKSRTSPNPTFARDENGHIISDATNWGDVTTLFAIACSRQLSTADLESEDEEYTRPTIQKSVVVIARQPIFGPLKEKLTVVTRSYFAQRNFEDRTIIDHLYSNLAHLFSLNVLRDESDLLVGLHLRELVLKFGAQVLVLFKALLLETKILFYAGDTDVLCTTQFALISLMPNLLPHLEDSGSPLLSTYETKLSKPAHLRTSDRDSLLKFMGLPLQLFAGGGMLNPFVPLQQIDDLKQKEMRYGMVGTTNNLFLSSGIDYDILVDIDAGRLEFENASLKPRLQLTPSDRVFIDSVVKSVRDSWDGHQRWEPRALSYQGSDDFVRHRFEDYVMSLLASVKYDEFLSREKSQTQQIVPREFPPNPSRDFEPQWIDRWKHTNNYRIFSKFTDEELFDIVDPVHVGTAAQSGTRFGKLLGFFRRLPPSLHSEAQ